MHPDTLDLADGGRLGPHLGLEHHLAVLEAGPGPAFDIPLLGSAVRVKTDQADDTFAVEVKPASPVAHTGVSVLEAQQWVHAVLMTRTLLVVEKACADE